MKFLRNRFVTRFISAFLLLTFLQPLFLPYYSYALTNGPHQPEYTSFDDASATDMVNLKTGDFSFNLPILTMPGPEGGFTLPLTYTAGVGLEQEASWVGLGWNINCGSLTRSINNFPDDANGEAQTVAVQDPDPGIKGWTDKVYTIGSFGWNTEQGHYGSLSVLGIVGAEWSQESWAGRILGVEVVGTEKFNVDPVQFAMGVWTIMTWGMGAVVDGAAEGAATETAAGAATTTTEATVAKAAEESVAQATVGEGAGAVAKGVASKAGAAAEEKTFADYYLDQIAETGKDEAYSAIADMLTEGPESESNASGYWQYSKRTKTRYNAAWGINKVKRFSLYLDKTRTEQMYGLMYLGNSPLTTIPSGGDYALNAVVSSAIKGTGQTLKMFQKSTDNLNTGAASDLTYIPDPSGMESYDMANHPVILSPDVFSVKASGISGTIEPYRLETGSVSMPREMTEMHQRLAPVPYLSNLPGTGYKVPFIYQGQQSSSYFQHVGSQNDPVTTPSFYFGVNSTFGTNSSGQGLLNYNFDDATLSDGKRIRSDISSTYNNKIPQSNYIEWYTNAEINNAINFPASKFMDFLNGGSAVSATSDRGLFRSTSAVYGQSATTSTSSFSATSIIYDGSLAGKFAIGSKVNLALTVYASTTDKTNGVSSEYATFNNLTVSGISPGTSGGTFSVNNDANSVTLSNYSNKIVDATVTVLSNTQTPFGVGGPNRIGGFCVTNADGRTYHFALPVYDFQEYSEVRETADHTKRSVIQRYNPFANTWVLTGITGPDFVDRNSNGVIDDSDWGSWVKFNYGIYENSYGWRMPWGDGVFQQDPTGNQESYTSGKKQLVYLNSIETRSHVALFLKGNRFDGRSADLDKNLHTLKLDEIVLLSKENYNKIISDYSVKDFTNSKNHTYPQAISDICLSSQFTNAALRQFVNQNCLKRILFNYDYSLCKHTPNSDVDVTNPNSGKLTLRSISFKGRNDKLTLPDYLFDYGNNPDYNANGYDSWGFYSQYAAAYPPGRHKVVQANADADGAAWSLNKITTPLGSEIDVNYERDSYSYVSGYISRDPGVLINFDNTFDASGNNTKLVYPASLPAVTLPVDNSGGLLQVGDHIQIAGDLRCKEYNINTNAQTFYGGQYNPDILTITAATATSITLSAPFMNIPTPPNSGDYAIFDQYMGTVAKLLDTKKGEGIRVSSIVTKDEFGNQVKARYLYDLNSRQSSGVIAQEPIWEGGLIYGDIAMLPGYPETPVVYGKVTVLTGPLTTDADYSTKHVYEFETPHYSQYTLDPNRVVNDNSMVSFYHPPALLIDYTDYIDVYNNKITDQTQKIGTLKSVKTYDGNNALYKSIDMTYTDQATNKILNNGIDNNQGVYSHGVLMVDRIMEPYNSDFKFVVKHKVNRTTVLTYPYTLKKITVNEDGFVSTKENLSWDLFSGLEDQTLEKNTLGLYTKTVKQFAYTVPAFSEMGPKANNKDGATSDQQVYKYKNMLNQVAATYVYRSDASGNSLGLIGATAQNWRKDWSNYRSLQGGIYTNEPAPTDVNFQVWRKGSSFGFVGKYSSLLGDGTQSFSVGDKFSFTLTSPNLTLAAQNPLWRQTNGAVRYDHFGDALESYDYISKIWTASKKGYDKRLTIANAVNASYTEIAFSSAEDLNNDSDIPTANYFGGEVALGGGTVLYYSQNQITAANTDDNTLSTTHTGDAVVAVTPGLKSFVYSVIKSANNNVSTPDNNLTNLDVLSTSKKYRVSVWTNSVDARIYYNYNNSGDVLSGVPDATKKVGNWYLLEAEIPALGGTFSSFEVGVKNVSTSGKKAVFDDFRFQPSDAVMTCYVYNPLKFIYAANQPGIKWVLDNNNLFTRFEISDDGLTERTYREYISPNANGVNVVSQHKKDLRRFH